MPMDSEWRARDRQCPEGKRYHCFEDGYGAVVDQGCFVVKKCIKGDVHCSFELFLLFEGIGRIRACLAHWTRVNLCRGWLTS